jgi:hypothetical protein
MNTVIRHLHIQIGPAIGQKLHRIQMSILLPGPCADTSTASWRGNTAETLSSSTPPAMLDPAIHSWCVYLRRGRVQVGRCPGVYLGVPCGTVSSSIAGLVMYICAAAVHQHTV